MHSAPGNDGLPPETRRPTALPRPDAELVDLVEHEDRVAAAHPPQLAQDPAGLRVSPGAVVAPQIRLVPQPAAGQLDDAASERVGDAPRQRGLAHSGRAGEADHGARAARIPPADGQVLEDALLGVVEPRVTGVERRTGLRQVGRRLTSPCSSTPATRATTQW